MISCTSPGCSIWTVESVVRARRRGLSLKWLCGAKPPVLSWLCRELVGALRGGVISRRSSGLYPFNALRQNCVMYRHLNTETIPQIINWPKNLFLFLFFKGEKKKKKKKRLDLVHGADYRERRSSERLITRMHVNAGTTTVIGWLNCVQIPPPYPPTHTYTTPPPPRMQSRAVCSDPKLGGVCVERGGGRGHSALSHLAISCAENSLGSQLLYRASDIVTPFYLLLC